MASKKTSKVRVVTRVKVVQAPSRPKAVKVDISKDPRPKARGPMSQLIRDGAAERSFI